jgi:SAM-dependent methyltransferase
MLAGMRRRASGFAFSAIAAVTALCMGTEVPSWLVKLVAEPLVAAELAVPGTEVAGQAQKRPDSPSLAPYVPTPQIVVDRMLQLAGVTKNDVVYDLGCGDGRIPITAAKNYGARGVGVDIDPQRIAEANANAKQAGVTHLVSFKLQDAMTTDVSEATVVTLYLLSASNLKLRPILTSQLRPGARIVSHAFSMGDWQADKVDTFTDTTSNTRTLYLWKTDGKVRP